MLARIQGGQNLGPPRKWLRTPPSQLCHELMFASVERVAVNEDDSEWAQAGAECSRSAAVLNVLINLEAAPKGAGKFF